MSAPSPTPSGLANLRDVAAGLPAGTIAPGIVFRSDAPLAGDAIPALPGWPPATVIDLRDPSELHDAHPYAESARVHVLPLLGAARPDQGKQVGLDPDLLVRLYRAMVKRHAAGFLVKVVEAVAREPGPILIHCAAGKDRTGVSVALLLCLVGVSREAVLTEYFLTDLARDQLVHRLAAHYALSVEGSELPEDVLRTSRPGIEAVLDVWEAHEGGAAGWYLEHGGTQATLAALQARLRP